MVDLLFPGDLAAINASKFTQTLRNTMVQLGTNDSSILNIALQTASILAQVQLDSAEAAQRLQQQRDNGLVEFEVDGVSYKATSVDAGRDDSSGGSSVAIIVAVAVAAVVVLVIIVVVVKVRHTSDQGTYVIDEEHNPEEFVETEEVFYNQQARDSRASQSYSMDESTDDPAARTAADDGDMPRDESPRLTTFQ